jgi:single-strand DNA-binding protein
MSDINNTVISGRLTKDPETKYLPSGKAATEFSIANNYTYGSGENKKEEVSFFSCTAFGKQGEVIGQYLSKGSKVALICRLKQERWEDQEGKKREKVKLIVDKFNFLDSKKSEKTEPAQETAQGTVFDNPFDDTEIPF